MTRYYELTINTKEADSLLKKVASYLPNPPVRQQKNPSFLSLEFYAQPEEIKKLEKQLKQDSLKYLLLTKKLAKKTIVEPRRKPEIIATKPKVELKEIDKKLEEILKES